MRMLLKPCALMPSSSASVTRGLPHEVSSAPVASSELPRFQPGCIAATAAIALPAGGGVEGGLVVGVGEGTLPVQAVPLSVNDVGAALLPVQAPLNPKETDAFVAMAAL
nr:hypothetical protein GCM10020092_101660 [Actinoplanes digitatis]